MTAIQCLAFFIRSWISAELREGRVEYCKTKLLWILKRCFEQKISSFKFKMALQRLIVSSYIFIFGHNIEPWSWDGGGVTQTGGSPATLFATRAKLNFSCKLNTTTRKCRVTHTHSGRWNIAPNLETNRKTFLRTKLFSDSRFIKDNVERIIMDSSWLYG